MRLTVTPDNSIKIAVLLGENMPGELAQRAKGAEPQRRGLRYAEQLAPPKTQNFAQWGWFNRTGRSASSKVAPNSNSGS